MTHITDHTLFSVMAVRMWSYLTHILTTFKITCSIFKSKHYEERKQGKTLYHDRFYSQNFSKKCCTFYFTASFRQLQLLCRLRLHIFNPEQSHRMHFYNSAAPRPSTTLCFFHILPQWNNDLICMFSNNLPLLVCSYTTIH